VRKLEAVYYPPDGRTYAYVDVVNAGFGRIFVSEIEAPNILVHLV
jgi:hypothetical protein